MPFAPSMNLHPGAGAVTAAAMNFGSARASGVVVNMSTMPQPRLSGLRIVSYRPGMCTEVIRWPALQRQRIAALVDLDELQWTLRSGQLEEWKPCAERFDVYSWCLVLRRWPWRAQATPAWRRGGHPPPLSTGRRAS